VSGAEEHGFELGGGEPDALVEHGVVEAAEGFGVGFGGLGVVGDGVGVEEPGPHGAYAVCCEGNSGGCGLEGYAFGDGFGGGFEFGVDLGGVGLETGEGGDSGGHGEGVSAEGSGLVDGAERREQVHEALLAAEDADGEASADNFAEGDEVGGEVVELAGAAEGYAEAGHYFVGDEQGAFAGGDGSQAGEIAGGWRDAAGVADDGLEDDGGDGARMGGEGGFDCVEVVVGQGEGEAGDFFGDSGGTGDAEGGDAGAGFDEEAVGVAVVAALEFDDDFAVGGGAGEADGGHGGLGAGADEAELFDGGIAGDYALGEVGLGCGGGAKAGGVAGGALDGFDYGREGVAEDHGTPGAEVVDVAVAVGVGEVGSLSALDKGGGSADGFECADGGVDAAGEEALGALLEGLGTGAGG